MAKIDRSRAVRAIRDGKETRIRRIRPFVEQPLVESVYVMLVVDRRRRFACGSKASAGPGSTCPRDAAEAGCDGLPRRVICVRGPLPQFLMVDGISFLT